MSDFRVLVVEDEKMINDSICEILQSEGYQIFQAFNGKEAINLFNKIHPEIIILDIMLPDGFGTELISTFRKDSKCGIMMLTAIEEMKYKKMSFIDGADDYITKPFDIDLLMLKIQALKRRIELETRIFTIHDLVIDYDKNTISYKDKVEYLQVGEMKVLKALFKAKENEEVLSKNTINQIIYDTEQNIDTRVHAVYITKIRNKLKNIGYRKIEIENVYGKGYQLTYSYEITKKNDIN